MSDRNALLQGNRNPVMVVGAIAGKCVMDFNMVQEFKENAENPLAATTCYPGGSNDTNHDIMPTYSSFGRKGTRSVDAADGDTEPTEVGIVSVAGLNWHNYCSQRQMEDDFYWQGIVTTESRLTHPNDELTEEPQSGYATIRCGTHSVPNNGPSTFYPGTLMAWRFPLAPFHPGDNSARAQFNNGETINQRARCGEPLTQFRPEYVPFDPTDFSTQLAAVFACITEANGVNMDGVADLPFERCLPHLMGQTGCREVSCLQDEAISYKYGLWGVTLTMLETLVRQGIVSVNDPAEGNRNDRYAAFRRSPADAHAAVKGVAEDIGLWNLNPTEQKGTILYEGLADVFLENLSPLEEARRTAVGNFADATNTTLLKISRRVPSNNDERYESLRANVSEVLLQGLTSSWQSKTSRIVGFATNTAAPSDTLDACFGHRRL
jgi:hypothetical protein